MNDDAIYKLYCESRAFTISGAYQEMMNNMSKESISKTLDYKLYKLRIRLWSFYMVFRGMFLNLFFGAKRFFK